MKRLILPLPPSMNHSHINVRKGHRLMRIRSERTKAYMAEAGWLARQWMVETGWKQTGEWVVMCAWIYWPDKRKRDADNALKILQDSLSQVLWDDDRQVLPRVMGIDVDRDKPRIELEIEVER